MTYNGSFNLVLAKSNHQESNNSNYNPSVPIAVYRQLAEELNATQTSLKYTEQKNEQLTQENQELRQELAHLIKQSEQLKQLVSNFEFTVNITDFESPVTEEKAQIKQFREETKAQNPKKPAKKPKTKVNQAKMVAEMQPQKSHKLSVSDPGETNGLFLAIAIIFILLTTFGAGLIVIKTYLGNNNR